MSSRRVGVSIMSKLNTQRLVMFFGIFLGTFYDTKDIVCRQGKHVVQDVVNSGRPMPVGQTSSAEWTIMIYMGARNNLAPFAASNLQDMAANAAGDKVNVVVQWDQSEKKGAWRYVAKNNQVELEQYVNVANPVDMAQNLIDFCKWSADNFAAKKYCLVLWNHGVGALDPLFCDPLRLFMQNRDVLSPSERFFCLDSFFKECEAESRAIQLRSVEPDFIDRGILFDEVNKTYLTNADLRYALSVISSSKVLNKKLDCLGFDACYMSMIEIAYQVKDFASYMISSEELELAKGWNYGYFISRLCENPAMTPNELARDVVKGFEVFYKGRTQLYTQAAIDLGKVEAIKVNHDSIIKSLESCLKVYRQGMLNALLKGRKSVLQFSAKFYVDLHSLYKTLAVKVLTEDDLFSGVTKEADILTYDSNYLRAKRYSNDIIALVELLKNGMRLIESAVLATANSNQFIDAKGLSIYFPSSKAIDGSYENTEFVKNSAWHRFLKLVCDFF